MKAAWYEMNGPARDVLVIGELPKPQAGPGEVLVRMEVSGVNPSDVKGRRGRPLAGPKVVPHSDGAGVIEATGAGVPESRVGERVWLWNAQWRRAHGTAAEYIALPSRQAVTLPDHIDFATGACLGIPGLTAVHAVNLLGATDGQTLLVTGGASAVGQAIIQIAAARGARVIATASAAKSSNAAAAGAAHVVDYKTEEVAARVLELTGGTGADAIVDMDFSTTVRLLSSGILAPHGRYICYGSNLPADNIVPFGDLLFKSITLRFFLVYELREEERVRANADLDALLAANRLIPTIAARFGLDDIVAAHEAVEAGRLAGNVVIGIR